VALNLLAAALARGVVVLADIDSAGDPSSNGALMDLVNRTLGTCAIVLVPLFAIAMVAVFVFSHITAGKLGQGTQNHRPAIYTAVGFFICEGFIGVSWGIAQVANYVVGGLIHV
jgi:hypothetical protein